MQRAATLLSGLLLLLGFAGVSSQRTSALREGRPLAPHGGSVRLSPSPSSAEAFCVGQTDVGLRRKAERAYPSSSGRSSQWAFKLTAEDIRLAERASMRVHV